MSTYHVPGRRSHGFLGGPSTRLGRRAVTWLGWSLALLVVVVFAGGVGQSVIGTHTGTLHALLGAIVGLVFFASAGFALAAGIAAAVAILRRGERALIVFVTLAPVLGVLFLLVHPLFIND